MSNSKNDIAWEKIFKKYTILDNISEYGSFSISAGKINEFREARLMTKFDHTSQLPSIFSNNNLSILPVNRGDYIIGGFETFKNFEEDDIGSLKHIDFPNYIETIDHKNITSESTALNCAFVAEILHDFLGEEKLYPTISGRMSSEKLIFTINTIKNTKFPITVENAQIEIDGGYEGVNILCLVEAKNYLSKDFIIRQLYYPYKLWLRKTTKRVLPVFLTYTNGIFHLRKYDFERPDHYNSITLINQQKYSIKEAIINLEAVQNILNNSAFVAEPEIPFPQADSFERVINLCELLKQKGSIKKEDITNNYDFDSRQTNYYTDAGRYLGFIDKKREGDGTVFYLSNTGNNLFELELTERQLTFIKSILTHAAFNKSLRLYFEIGGPPSKDQIIQIMKTSLIYNIDSENTYSRRASTILSWLSWIIKQMKE